MLHGEGVAAARRWAGVAMALFVLAGCGGSDAPSVAGGADPGVSVCKTAFREASSARFWTKDLSTGEADAVTLSSCAVDANRNVTIGGGAGQCGPRVVIDESFQGDKAFGKITVASDGELVLRNKFLGDMVLETAGIQVAGRVSLGTAECPVGWYMPEGEAAGARRPTFTVSFKGSRAEAAQGANETGSDKGIEVASGGVLRMYGVKGIQPVDGSGDAPAGVSWTYLSRPAGPLPADIGQPASYYDGIAAPVDPDDMRARRLHLAHDVSTGSGAWEAGDWIVVATTSFSPYESEFVRIDSVRADGNGGSVVTLRDGLRHYHFGGKDPGRPSNDNYGAGQDINYGVDERAEVGLISRSIRLTAQTTAAEPHWGGELRLLRGFREASIQGVEMEKFGKDRLGSYPIHFHMAGNMQEAGSRHLINSNSVHHSYNKCVTIHMTQGTTIQNTVCARAVGHLFYQEIGDEKGTRYLGNLGIGAMSHYFGIAEEGKGSAPRTPDGLIRNWWEGDYLARENGYDGLGVKNMDEQRNPTRGGCFRSQNHPTLGLLVAGTRLNQTGIKSEDQAPTCAPDEMYVESPTGFWIINPGTELQGNSIAGCQGLGRGYWYVPPSDNWRNVSTKHEPVGAFVNNRVHGCYDGLFGEGDDTAVSEQLFPRVDGDPLGRSVVARFEGFTATRIRNRGVWMRPMWNVVEQGRFATSRDAVTLVSSGGNDGNAPGVWALLRDSVLVGVSQNNFERWGPCADLHNGEGEGPGCVDLNLKANAVVGKGYQMPRWNSAGYMIYDGPVRIVRNHFVNYRRDPGALLTTADAAFMKGYLGYPNAAAKTYEGDAALGWFQSNQSAYPTASVSRALSFHNVDLRHQIYTEGVNLGDFEDGDKNTAIIDLDGTLTGFRVVDAGGNPAPGRFPISLNNLEFNRAGNAVDECLAKGAQDALVEDRATSMISPASYATLEFEAFHPDLDIAKVPSRDPASADYLNPMWQDMVFTKNTPDVEPGGSLSYATMRLRSRNRQGIWEPKVASGYGYNVAPAQTTKPNPKPEPTRVPGMPARVRVGLTDAVKPDMGQDPFHVRVGIFYANANSTPIDGSTFRIRRGYKSWGGAGVEYNSPEMKRYFNMLTGSDAFCHNMDDQNRQNLDPVKGCPAPGVVPKLAGEACPAGSKDNTQGVCVFPVTDLKAAASIDELTNADGTPRSLDKFYFDTATSVLYFYVVQDVDNAHGPSPLGSCAQGSDADKAKNGCPGADELDTFYSCPAQGCINYDVVLNDPNYKAGFKQDYTFDHARFGMPEPPQTHRLATLGTDGSSGAVVTPVPTRSSKHYLHWTASEEPVCGLDTRPVVKAVSWSDTLDDHLTTWLARAQAPARAALGVWQRGTVPPASRPGIERLLSESICRGEVG